MVTTNEEDLIAKQKRLAEGLIGVSIELVKRGLGTNKFRYEVGNKTHHGRVDIYATKNVEMY